MTKYIKLFLTLTLLTTSVCSLAFKCPTVEVIKMAQLDEVHSDFKGALSSLFYATGTVNYQDKSWFVLSGEFEDEATALAQAQVLLNKADYPVFFDDGCLYYMEYDEAYKVVAALPHPFNPADFLRKFR